MSSEIEIKKRLMSVIPDEEYVKKAEFDKFPLIKNEVFNSKDLYESFLSKPDECLKKFNAARIRIKGIAIKVELDIHGLPSVEVSDKINGVPYILCVFIDKNILTKVEKHSNIIIEGNYLVFHTDGRIVLKNCELIQNGI